jgi:hypothetical protein
MNQKNQLGARWRFGVSPIFFQTTCQPLRPLMSFLRGFPRELCPGFVRPCLPTKAPHPPTGALWLHEIITPGSGSSRVVGRPIPWTAHSASRRCGRRYGRRRLFLQQAEGLVEAAQGSAVRCGGGLGQSTANAMPTRLQRRAHKRTEVRRWSPEETHECRANLIRLESRDRLRKSV